MKYLLIRITVLILAMVAINYIRDYIGERRNDKFGYLYAKIWFFRLLFWLSFVSLGIFSYEAYQFNKQKKIKERNRSSVLVALVVLIVLFCVKHFMEFSF